MDFAICAAFTARAVNSGFPMDCRRLAMTRDPLREQPAQPGEQRGKRDAEQYEDRGAGDAPDTLIPADDDTPAKTPGSTP
ncbi:hypothetical protein XcodCFBP4690_13170 [Xanthomonas codiaei]|uniref:Uncharacterized protein n=2 Tax=Xanthomonas codiaei TaxID=56463 RepID=A0A2S7CN12_9XANT|nr:hypothetical protein XcodCFBP4690_13170 [Xanthomonas codiaei]